MKVSKTGKYKNKDNFILINHLTKILVTRASY